VLGAFGGLEVVFAISIIVFKISLYIIAKVMPS